VLRTALTLSMATGQGFELRKIRTAAPRPGLRLSHVAAIRAAALACGARFGGAFDGSPDLRFEPGPVSPGEFRFEQAGAEPAVPLLQMLLVALSTGPAASRVQVTGGTHVPSSPTFEYLARHWAAVMERLGWRMRLRLERAGFHPAGGGELHGEVEPWTAAGGLSLATRGALVELRGVSGSARLRTGAAEQQAEAARRRLWELRRLEASWEVVALPAESPGAFLMLQAVFEQSRAAFAYIGRRGMAPDALGDRAARALIAFLEGEGAVDPFLGDQLAVPLALAGGGCITTSELTSRLQETAAVLGAFGYRALTSGRVGGPGAVEIGH
jgi:RNA 3'-terminal phosphate cyclase (ATP)